MNADDFGRHELINRAVEQAFNAGCLKSASIMASGVAFDDAVKIAQKYPGLGVGIHFTLVNGKPVLPPDAIPSLVTEEGFFHGDYMMFLMRYVCGKISLAEVRAELAAQLETVSRTGLKLTHIDSHQHLHHVPGITQIALELAATKNIAAMRVANANVFDGALDSLGQFVGRLGLSALAKWAAHSGRRKGFAMPDHFAGIVAGESVSEPFMIDLIKNLREGTTEIMFHPGSDNAILQDFCHWKHDFEEEFSVVTSRKVLKVLTEKNVSVVNFAELVR